MARLNSLEEKKEFMVNSDAVGQRTNHININRTCFVCFFHSLSFQMYFRWLLKPVFLFPLVHAIEFFGVLLLLSFFTITMRVCGQKRISHWYTCTFMELRESYFSAQHFYYKMNCFFLWFNWLIGIFFPIRFSFDFRFTYASSHSWTVNKILLIHQSQHRSGEHIQNGGKKRVNEFFTITLNMSFMCHLHIKCWKNPKTSAIITIKHSGGFLFLNRSNETIQIDNLVRIDLIRHIFFFFK